MYGICDIHNVFLKNGNFIIEKMIFYIAEQFTFEEVHFYYGNSFQTFVENVKQKLGKPGKYFIDAQQGFSKRV